jgi:hypothetical protein
METLIDNLIDINIEITEDKILCEYGELEYSLEDKTVIVNSLSVYLKRNKIGTRLVAELESRFRNLNFESVEVPTSPTKEAVLFWRSLRYKPLSDDDKYWANKIARSYKESSWDTPQGVVVMKKQLH